MSREQKRFEKELRHFSPEFKAEDTRISRRKFLIGMAAVAEAFVFADQGLAKVIWNDKQTEVAMLPEHKDTTSDELWLVSPGLGVQSSFGIASTLRTSLELMAPVAFMQLSDEGFAKYEVVEQLNKLAWERKIKRLRLFGHSIGTIAGLDIVNDSDVKEINCVIADGSPFDVDDVKDEKLAAILEKITSAYPPGYISKLIGETINSTWRDPNHDLSIWEQLQDAARVTGSGVAPAVWRDQMSALVNANEGSYANKVKETADTAYISPIDPNLDRVVKVLQAHGKYNDKFYNSMASLPLDTRYHACPTDFPGQYNEGLTMHFRSLVHARANPRLHKP